MSFNFLAHRFTSYDKPFIWIFIIDDDSEKNKEKSYKVTELYMEKNLIIIISYKILS